MQLIYAQESYDIPRGVKRVFLAGPSPRQGSEQSWRPAALEALEKAGYDGAVFIPEPRPPIEWAQFHDYDAQVEWEWKALESSHVISFWVPRGKTHMIGLTTNVEFGMFVDAECYGQRVILGYPKDAEKMRYLRWHADRCHVPSVHTLDDLAAKVMEYTE
jgi:hypothetical protein